MPNTDKSRPDRKPWIVDDKILVALTTTKIYFNVINRLTNVHTDTQIELFIISASGIVCYRRPRLFLSWCFVCFVCVCVFVFYVHITVWEFFFARVKSSSSSVVINGASYARTSGRYAKMTESTSDTWRAWSPCVFDNVWSTRQIGQISMCSLPRNIRRAFRPYGSSCEPWGANFWCRLYRTGENHTCALDVVLNCQNLHPW